MTAPALPPLILGANVFGWSLDAAASERLLDAALERGLTAIDTADVYSYWGAGNSGGESETIIGNWMRKRGNRNRVAIHTKGGAPGAPGGLANGNATAAYLAGAVDNSLRRLGVERIDLYYIHYDDKVTPPEETLGGFQRMIAAGKIAACGASNFSAERLAASLDASRRDALPRYAALQTHYNLYDRAGFETDLAGLCRQGRPGRHGLFRAGRGLSHRQVPHARRCRQECGARRRCHGDAQPARPAHPRGARCGGRRASCDLRPGGARLAHPPAGGAADRQRHQRGAARRSRGRHGAQTLRCRSRHAGDRLTARMMDDADGKLTGMTPQLTEIASGLGFPEGPVMLPDGGMLVVEIARGCITRIGRDGRKHVLARPGGGPNGAAFGPDGFLYVCNSGGFSWRTDDGRLIPSGQAADYSGGRIERVDIETGKVEVIYTACDGFPLKGPNDIVFDRDGGFYFTDHGKRRPREVDLGGLFYAKTDGSLIREIVQPMIMPNGVGLSPDEKTVYVAETRTGHLWGFDIVAPGVLQRGPPHENGGRHLAGPAGYTSFDSLAVERGGNICVASLVLGGINVIAPDGAFVGFVPMPDPICTNICFGGADLRTAYITLSSTGRIVSLPWPREGLRLNFDPCGR